MNFFKKKQQNDPPTPSQPEDTRLDAGLEEEGELFEHLETSDTGLFEGMDTVQSPLSSIKHKNNNLEGFGANLKED